MKGKVYFLCHAVRGAGYTCRKGVIDPGAQAALRIDVVLYTLCYSHSRESMRYQLPAEHILMSIFLLIVALQIVTYPSGGSWRLCLQWS